MQATNDESVDNARQLIAAVQRRLSRQHTIGLMGWFILAGLSLAFVPLAASKIHFCNSWVTTILPALTLTFAFVFGAFASWTSQPTLKTAALRIDRSLASKELFITALESRQINPAIPIHRLFCQNLDQACQRGEVRQIVPSRINQVSKFLTVILLVDVALFATPNMPRANHAQIERLQDHVSRWTAAKENLTQEEQADLESLRQAKTPESLHANAKKMWLKLKEIQKAKLEALSRQLNELEAAIKRDDLKTAKRIKGLVSKALEKIENKEAQEIVKERLQEIAINTGESSLSKDIVELGRDGNGSSAGKGKPTRGSRQNPAETEDDVTMEDLLVTVFGSLGEALPENSDSELASTMASRPEDAPKEVQSSRQVSALGLSKTEELQVLRYLELRRARR